MKTLIIPFFLLIPIILFAQNEHAEYIEGPYKTVQEVTKGCLECHEEVANDIMHTSHWTWLGPEFETPEGKKTLGKKNMINNFCIAVPSNWPRCTSCHIGYGWKDENFDFTKSENIDCLICHEQTGTYKKIPTGAGMPVEGLDLLKIARSVEMPTRANCGICHFDGGGGTGVKHGDMDDSLYHPSEELDVHMGGQDFECTECHITEKHQIAGASHSSMAAGTNHISCDNPDCHDKDPHEKKILNKHSDAVACETCHIPTFARGMPTKIWWDWSDAGKDLPGKKDEYGKPTFHKKKGSFIWKKNVKPEYAWYNGKADYYMLGDKIDPDKVVMLNKPEGDISDPKARIAPFKVMRGKQPYDPVYKYLVVPHLFGKDGFWKTFDWNASSAIGMKTVGLDYSGTVDFVETAMYWPINHTVMPAEKALKCTQCHGWKGNKVLDWEALGYAGDPMKRSVKKKRDYLKK